MLKVLLVNLDLEMERELISLCQETGLFGSFTSVKKNGDAIRELRDNPVDTVFYDPGNDVTDSTAFAFLERFNQVPVVVVSRNPHWALKAYNYRNVVDYLTPPLEEIRFMESLNRILEFKKKLGWEQPKPNMASKYIFVNVKKKLIRIELDDIYYILSQGDYITLYTSKGQLTTYGTLKALRDQLPENRFVDVHRSYLINLDHVVDIENNSVLIGKAVIPISRLKRKQVLEKIHCI